MTPYSTPKKQARNKGCAWIVLIIIVIVIGYVIFRNLSDNNYLNQARQAYNQGKCDVAIKLYDNIINAWRFVDIGGFSPVAAQERAECQAFQIAVEQHQSGKPSEAIITYHDFINNYGHTSLAKEARNRISVLFEQTNLSILTDKSLCDRLFTLKEENLIPQEDSLLPPLIYGCGQVYDKINDFSSAILWYEYFLYYYKNHPLASSVEETYARTIVLDARASGAGTIPRPPRSGTTGTGSTAVIIQNDSPQEIRIIFSGPESRIEQLASCSSCIEYYGSGPTYCPDKGPIGRYTLPPGDYDVVVQSVSATGVIPWSGRWELISGDEYSNCFFITTSTNP